jgi:hypothetical protein
MLESLDRLYVRACKFAGKIEHFKLEKLASDRLRENLEIAELKVKPEEVVALSILSVFSWVPIAFFLIMILKTGPSSLYAVLLSLPFVTCLIAGWYPKIRADGKIFQGLSEITALISQLVFAMKILPNAERAINFTSSKASGPLGRDLRRFIKKSYFRIYASAEEAIMEFSIKWKMLGEDLRSAIRLVFGSSCASETNRIRMLDQAHDMVLRNVRERMREFASGLHLPLFVIYSMGVLLPLVLIGVLPIVSTFNFSFGAFELFLIYCVILPAGVYALNWYVLMKRPMVFPSSVPEVKINRARAATISISILAFTLVANFLFEVNFEYRALIFLWIIAVSISAYLHFAYSNALKERMKTIAVENELCVFLKKLGGVMAEGRPAEDAMKRAAREMKDSPIAGIFLNAAKNVRLGNMGLASALFDKKRGALKDMNSKMISDVLRALIENAGRDTRKAGNAIASAGEHLEKIKEVERELKNRLSEITSSMKSVVVFFLPLVASVTTSMQARLGLKISQVGFLASNSTVIPPWVFILTLGIHALLLTTILVECITKIEVGDDQIFVKMAISRTLPVALGVFTLGAVASQIVFESIMG